MELLAHAPTQAAMWSWLRRMGWADSEEDFVVEGVQLSIVGVVPLTPDVVNENGEVVTPGTRATGVHFNLRFYGDAAEDVETFIDADEETGARTWNFTNFNSRISNRNMNTVTPVARGVDNVKAGYRCNRDNVRVFDPVTVGKRYNVWA